MNHLELNRAIVNSQHGFMRARSCSTNLLSILEPVIGFVDNGDSMDVILSDLAEAFGKSPHHNRDQQVVLNG